MYLTEKFGIKSFLDIGCGPGGMVQLAAWRGLDAMGIDGDWEVRKEPEAKILQISEARMGVMDIAFNLATGIVFVSQPTLGTDR